LQNFIRDETQNHYDQLAEDAVIALLDAGEELDTTRIYSLLKLVRLLMVFPDCNFNFRIIHLPVARTNFSNLTPIFNT
jgi:hypothetical protein